MRERMTWLGAVLLAVAGCGADGAPLEPDASNDVDAAATPDAAISDLFVVEGDCGVLDTELTDPAPSVFESNVVFSRVYTEAEMLSVGGEEILSDGNAGGSSLLSEVFAFEVLNACESLTLLKTETEVDYDVEGAKTDFLATIDGLPIGVSVTRAQTFPLGTDMNEAAALYLLDKKLAGILESSANVSAGDSWSKQILAVMIYNRQHLATMLAALEQVAPATRADTVVWLTVTDGPDDFIYQ